MSEPKIYKADDEEWQTKVSNAPEVIDAGDLQLELRGAGARFTALELVLPEEMPKEQWAHLGRILHRAGEQVNWWLGDWAAFGVRKYGELKDFASLNGIDYGHLKNLSWVSQSVEKSHRCDFLSWTVHREVASLPARAQAKWLEKAKAESLSVAALRKQIRIAGGEINALESEGKSLEMGTKLFDDLIAWLKSRPEEFWTWQVRGIWRGRIEGLLELVPE